jgi:hypothetical protein
MNWTKAIDNWTDIDITSEDESLVLTWEYIGEGVSGDYDWVDPNDRPHLRFTVSVPGDEYNQVDDASYCTLMSPATPIELLEFFGNSILSVVQDNRSNYKRRLEYMTWTTESEIKDAIRIETVIQQHT